MSSYSFPYTGKDFSLAGQDIVLDIIYAHRDSLKDFSDFIQINAGGRSRVSRSEGGSRGF